MECQDCIEKIEWDKHLMKEFRDILAVHIYPEIVCKNNH